MSGLATGIAMLRNTTKLRICVLLLGLVFLAAQFHLCAELTTANGTTHFCPYCATAGAAIVALAPSIALAPTNALVESVRPLVLASVDIWFSIAPRAPPSL